MHVVNTLKVNEEIYQLRVYAESPPLGHLCFNSFVILGEEPILVDTHSPLWRAQYFEALRQLVDLEKVRWIFLTHDDRDHSGNVVQVLEACPNATLVTQWLMVGRMKDEFVLPIHRLRFCNPGEPWTASGRTFSTFVPTIFDSPSSIGLFDPKHETLFPADAFGALTKQRIDEASDVSEAEYDEAFMLFNGMWGWVHDVDRGIFAKRLETIRAFAPRTILSSHGPIARGNYLHLLETMARVPDAPPFVGMNQAGLEARIAALTAEAHET